MKLLFVCTGNTCRSALAEAIASRIVSEKGTGDIEVSSAGTSVFEGAPASDAAILVGIEEGLDLSAHRATQLTREIVEAQDLILVMGPHHLDRVEALGGSGRSHLLNSYATAGKSQRPIADPFGGDLEAYRTTFEELEVEIHKAFDRLTSERARKR